MTTKKNILDDKSKKKHNSVPVSDLAKKYNCSRSYVSKLLRANAGETILARKIIKDANDIIAILERDTIITI